MARYILDFSALVNRYQQERGSAEVEDLFNRPGNRFLISRLALVEMHSSFSRLVREGVLTVEDFGKLIARLDDDVAAGILTVAALTSRRLAEASSILDTQGLKYTIRTLDAIHLSTAQALHVRSRLAAFVAADKKLLAVAANACGFTVQDVS